MDSIPNERGDFDRRLHAARFRRRSADLYQRKRLLLECGSRWLTVWTSASPQDTRLCGGQPGLWKVLSDPQGAGLRREFHVPRDLVASERLWDPVHGREVDPLHEMLGWVSDTARGKIPRGWRSPAAEELHSLVPDSALTVSAGRYVRQGSIVAAAERLAIRIPLLLEAPAELPESRRAWLGLMLNHVQDRCRMARVVVTPPHSTHDDAAAAVQVEVDLSGAPACVLPSLLPLGVDAARSVVSWFIAPVTVLADPTVSSSAWSVDPERIWSAL